MRLNFGCPRSRVVAAVERIAQPSRASLEPIGSLPGALRTCRYCLSIGRSSSAALASIPIFFCDCTAALPASSAAVPQRYQSRLIDGYPFTCEISDYRRRHSWPEHRLPPRAAIESARAGRWRDILVVDKGGIAAGASGIACGVVRNNYFQPAMRELMAHSVGVWETDPEGYSYHPVGYMQISPESMHEDVASIARQQKDIGYESTFIEGEKDSSDYMKTLFHDWQAKGITSVLHEKRGGYANNTKAMYALATKAEKRGCAYSHRLHRYRLQE